jgi:hypothetical protein
MDRMYTMARFDESENVQKVDCCECGLEFNSDDVEYSIGDDVFCGLDCATEHVVRNIDSFMDIILD